ncbi:hypothetical protein ACHAXA_002272 [Cyclostephanos tholiformis]|uniref:Uncharacterized protein n=1 Tax=Cyclostephanos tholiformis TaxID=382380 RepID=A0ABD3RTQ9_9STRA
MEDIDDACRGFARSVDDYIVRANRARMKKNRLKRKRLRGENFDDDDDDDDDHDDASFPMASLRDECLDLVKHANLVLRTLKAKRLSLSNALIAFGEASNACVMRFADNAHTATTTNSSSLVNVNLGYVETSRIEAARRWFTIYLRLRDGFVLMESGERRHIHDFDDIDNDDDINDTRGGGEGKVDETRRERKFPSKLGDGCYQSDGITRKYSSSNGYTGRGYDEFYDEDVGIRRRLLMALSIIDDNRHISKVSERLFDSDERAISWESHMDEHVRECTSMRDDLRSIVAKFEIDVNRHLPPTRKLTLNSDDKFERMKLGDQLDIERRGNEFRVCDRGGSLPVGMSVDDWRKRFGLLAVAVRAAKEKQKTANASRGKDDDNCGANGISSSTTTTRVAVAATSSEWRIEGLGTGKKKRKVILDDSSEDDDDDDGDVVVTRDTTDAVAFNSTIRDVDGDGHDDGLMVRVRVPTDVSDGHRGGDFGDGDLGHHTTSVDEVKRRLGVDNMMLQSGRERLEDEQLRSTMAANEEDFLEGILRDEDDLRCERKTNEGKHYYSTHAPLLKECYASRKETRKIIQSNELLREMQEVCSAFDDSVIRWNDNLQSLLDVRRIDTANGLLDETVDRSYMARENFREANMLLGIDSIEVYDFFSQLQKNRTTAQTRVSSRAIPEHSLSKACHSFLAFAQETFKTALNLVLEHERCQTTNSAMVKIEQLWEKGQHLLLRGRAHHNIGHTIYEMASYTTGAALAPYIGRRQVHQGGGGQYERNTRLLMKAKKEFEDAVHSAKSMRHNTLLIRRHKDANDISSQSIYSWTTEATLQLLEAIKLETLASGFLVICLWKLGETDAANKSFNAAFESVDISDIMNHASTKGVSLFEIAEVLCDLYWFAMRVAGLSTQSLERMSIGKGWDISLGEALFQITLTALNRACVISDQLFSSVDVYSLDSVMERDIATAVSIRQEENEIRKWWETTKAWAHTKISDVARSGSAVTNFHRSEVAGDFGDMSSFGVVAPLKTRRIIIHDNGRSLQDRFTSCRTIRAKKNDGSDVENEAMRFSSNFCSGNKGTAKAVDASAISSMGRVPNAKIVYRKWGNEVLDEHERRRFCPALPENFVEMGISIDVIRALEKKLGHILPSRN